MKRLMIGVVLATAMSGCYRPYTPPPPTYYSQPVAPAGCGCAPVQTQCVPVTSQCVPVTSQCVPVGGPLRPNVTYAPPPVSAYGTQAGVYNPGVPALPPGR